MHIGRFRLFRLWIVSVCAVIFVGQDTDTLYPSSFAILMAVFSYVMNSYGTFAVRFSVPVLDSCFPKLIAFGVHRPAP